MSIHPFPTPLVSTSWLVEHLGAPHLTVLDASTYLPSAGRDARAEYEAAHIPGALFADLTWLSDETAPYPHTLPNAEIFAERMGALGVSSDDAIVVYDASKQNFSAPRLWWMLRAFGHRNVSVLDGGFFVWTHEGRATSDAMPTPAAARFVARLDPSRVWDIEAMRANVDSRAVQVVDARSSGRFEATEPEPRAGVRGGHVPGSVSMHYATLVDASGKVFSATELRDRMEHAGIDLTKPIVASCGTGVTACAVVLALETMGIHNTPVYDGSWTEWGSTAGMPVEIGPARRP